MDGFKVVIAFFFTIGLLLFGFKQYYDKGITEARAYAQKEESERLRKLYEEQLRIANTVPENIVMRQVESMPFIMDNRVMGYPYGQGYTYGYTDGYNQALEDAGVKTTGRFQFLPE